MALTRGKQSQGRGSYQATTATIPCPQVAHTPYPGCMPILSVNDSSIKVYTTCGNATKPRCSPWMVWVLSMKNDSQSFYRIKNITMESSFDTLRWNNSRFSANLWMSTLGIVNLAKGMKATSLTWGVLKFLSVDTGSSSFRSVVRGILAIPGARHKQRRRETFRTQTIISLRLENVGKVTTNGSRASPTCGPQLLDSSSLHFPA